MVHVYIFLLVTAMSGCSAYIYTSVQKTKEMVNVESILIGELGNYITNVTNDGQKVLDEIITFYNQSFTKNQMALNSSSFIENPLNLLQFVKRLHEGWTRIVTLLNLDESEENGPLGGLKKQISEMESEDGISLFHMEGDLTGAYTGIERLRRTYKLNLQDLIRGKLLDEQSDPLSANDVLGICKVLDEKDEFIEELRWLEALRSTMNETSTDMTKIVRQLASALGRIEDYQQALLVLKEQQKNDPQNKKLKADIDFFKNKQSKDVDPSHTALSMLEDRPSSVYETLCRGEGERSIRITSKLKCIYRQTAIPIYMAKEEILSIVPRISIVYNVTYESEQNLIKQYATIRMKDSTVANEDGSTQIATHFRVSQTAWFDDIDSPVFNRVCRRVELITGLSTNLADGPAAHAEPLQVLNYGLGGMYVPHIDVLNSSTLELSGDIRGDRLATWMFYLNDVKAGGSTVFPVLNVSVPVTKGAAAFWYNLRRNGETDDRLSHAGCPVLLGSKWVANKWIRARGQIFRRRCGLSFMSTDGLFDTSTKLSRQL